MKKPLSGRGRKQKGARRELQCVKTLEEWGFMTTKAGGSLGAFDVIGMGEFFDVFVQVKSNRPPAKQEYTLLRNIAKQYSNPSRFFELWIYHDGIKDPEIIPLFNGHVGYKK